MRRKAVNGSSFLSRRRQQRRPRGRSPGAHLRRIKEEKHNWNQKSGSTSSASPIQGGGGNYRFPGIDGCLISRFRWVFGWIILQGRKGNTNLLFFFLLADMEYTVIYFECYSFSCLSDLWMERKEGKRKE
ncbi:unnamed protein product [Lactuca virosa]|uniref:Uncharacterized protein n=1 Tax=Lactuca virosa TaxID=75947 RepID=A0AAU9LUD1_9ASTR|nr:unnamed protein product [Lactuca virosa]